MKLESVAGWAVVKDGKILSIRTTREDARSIKRVFKQNGLDTKIAKLTFDKFVR